MRQQASVESAPVVDGSTREILRRLELDVTRRLDGLLHGDHRGLVPGHGSELGETRSYQLGDDVRRIDWNVSARLQSPYIRQTIAERELQTWLVVDCGPRMNFGTALCAKKDLALSAAAAMGFLTARDGNQIGALLAGPEEPTVFPAKGSRKHMLRILSMIHNYPTVEGSGVTRLTDSISRLTGLARRRGMVAIISDFRVDDSWRDSVAVLARQHDVLAIEVVDPLELTLPNVGLVSVLDPATGLTNEIATHKSRVREAYAAAAADRAAGIRSTFASAGVDHLVLHTDRPWLDDLVRFVARRRHRLNSMNGASR